MKERKFGELLYFLTDQYYRRYEDDRLANIFDKEPELWLFILTSYYQGKYKITCSKKQKKTLTLFAKAIKKGELAEV